MKKEDKKQAEAMNTLYLAIAELLMHYWDNSEEETNAKFSTICAALLNVFSTTLIHQMDESESKTIKIYDDVMGEARKMFLKKLSRRVAH